MRDAAEIRQRLTTVFARSLLKPLREAVEQYELIQAGDTVAVCLSGGKDSMLLALLLQQMQNTMPFRLLYLAMDPGYGAAGRRQLEENAAALDIPLEIFSTDVLRIAGNHAAAHPCFLCAKMRRGHLYAEAQKRGANKIALGHHFDDAIATVLMGLLYGGQVQAMLPRVRAAHYAGMELIRPLYLVREREVLRWVADAGMTFAPCDCPAKRLAGDTKRAEIRALIDRLAAENPQVEQNILNAVKNVDTAKLLGWRDAAGTHSFLDGVDGKTWGSV